MGYYIVFNMIQFQVKDEVKHILKHSVPQEDLVLISISDADESQLIWTKPNKEFRFQGEMYDIVDIIKKGNKTLYRCLHDFKESKLFAHLDVHINNYIAHNAEQQNKAKSFFNVMAKLFFFQSEESQIVGKDPIENVYYHYTENYKSVTIDLLNPPPENYILPSLI